MARSGQAVVGEAACRAEAVLARCRSLHVPPRRLRGLAAYGRLCVAATEPSGRRLTRWVLWPLLVAALAVVYHLQLYTVAGLSRLVFMMEGISDHAEPCTIEVPHMVVDLITWPVNCSRCDSVHQVDRVSNISAEHFELKYAYSGRPVVVTDGTAGWTALQLFSFAFFKQLYDDDSPVIEGSSKGCQFFPYKTKFNDLGEVFSMPMSRANMEKGEEPWYIGWSNCDSAAANELRRHYQRPYFLPATAESSRLDWIFMGTPGFGAHLHLDHVRNPSWQAQLLGRKLWTLEPPPECRSVCSSMQTTVGPGEIIVLDTNMWYHMTKIVSDNISITIGSEYD